MKKILSLFLILTIVVTLTSCKKEDSTVSVFFPEMSDTSGNLLAAYQEAIEKSGVKVTAKVGNGSATTLDMLIAAKDYPTLFNISGATDLDGYISDGFIQPLEELLKDHGPNIWNYLQSNKQAKDSVTYRDGHIYSIPTFKTDVNPTETTYFIRGDWLDEYTKANSKPATWEPKTAQDFETLFTWWDANIKTYEIGGDGKPVQSTKKPIMWVERRDVSGSNSHRSVPAIMGLFGANAYFYAENDEVKYGPIAQETEWKTALNALRTWRQKGWYDELTLSKDNQPEAFVSSDRGAMFHDTTDKARGLQETCSAVNPKCEIRPLTPPQGLLWQINSSAETGFRKEGTAMASPATQAQKINAIKFLDYFFTEEGQLLANYGFLGETYEMKTTAEGVSYPALIEGITPDILKQKGIREFKGFGTISKSSLDIAPGKVDTFMEAILEKNSPYFPINNWYNKFRVGVSILDANGEVDATKTAFWTTGNSALRRPVLDAYFIKVLGGTANTTSDYTKFIADSKAATTNWDTFMSHLQLFYNQNFKE